MFIEELGRHLSVCGINEVPMILKRDPDFWNVISITESHAPRARFIKAKKIHQAVFDDIEDAFMSGAEGFKAPTQDDLMQALAFVDTIPGEPIIIHCRAGISRSTALAAVLLVRGCIANGTSIDPAAIADQLLTIRYQAVPNELVMRLGFGLCMSAEDAEEMVRAISNEPRLANNRFINPTRR